MTTQCTLDPTIVDWLRRTESPRLAQPQTCAEAPAWTAYDVTVGTRLGQFKTPGQYLCAVEGDLARRLRHVAQTHRTVRADRLRAVIRLASEWGEVWADTLCRSEASPLALYAWLLDHCDHLERVLYEEIGGMSYADKILALSVASETLYAASACYRTQED